jgi:hypothetical protein
MLALTWIICAASGINQFTELAHAALRERACRSRFQSNVVLEQPGAPQQTDALEQIALFREIEPLPD